MVQRERRQKEQNSRYERYITDPHGFCVDHFHESYTSDVVQVMESVRDNRVTIARSANSVGKSHAAARIALWFYKVFPDCQIYMTAAPPLENLRKILWGQIAGVALRHPDMFTNDKIVSGRLEIARNAQSFISGVAIPTTGTAEEREAKFSGKHAPHLLFIVDEGDAVPEEVYKGIESCMSGAHDRLLIMFNPRAAMGTVHYKETHRQANVIELSALRHPNVLEDRNVYAGAVTREVTVRRINMWTRPLGKEESVDADCWKIPQFLVGSVAEGLDGTPYPPLEDEWRKIVEPSFSYMVLGQYPAQSSSQLISRAWVDAARDRYDNYVREHGEVPPAGVRPIMGQDVAELGEDSNVACFRYNSLVLPFDTWKGIDPDETSIKAYHTAIQKNAEIVLVDGTGVGSSVAPAMARMARERKKTGFRAVSVKVAGKPTKAIKSELGEFYQLRDQLWWAVREWLRTDQSSMLPPDRLLLQELLTPLYSVKETGKIKVTGKDDMRELLKRSTDRADALCLTFLPKPVAKVIRIGEAIQRG